MDHAPVIDEAALRASRASLRVELLNRSVEPAKFEATISEGNLREQENQDDD
jgi:hypothetical protein